MVLSLKYSLFGFVKSVPGLPKQTAPSFSFNLKVWSILQRGLALLNLNGDASSTVIGAIGFSGLADSNVKKPLVAASVECCNRNRFHRTFGRFDYLKRKIKCQ